MCYHATSEHEPSKLLRYSYSVVGIAGTADAQKYADLGADVVLVGESLVKDGDPERAVAAMRAIVSAPAKS